MTYNGECIHELVSHSDANINLCVTVYRLIENAPLEEQTQLFTQFLIEYKYTKTDLSWDTFSAFSDEKEDAQVKEAQPVLEQIVGAAKKKPSAQEVNAEIWMQISNKTNHPDEKGRIALLFCCAKSKSLPYVDTSNLAIATTEQLSEQLDKMDPVIVGMVSHISGLGMDKVSEDASLYVPLLDQCQNLEEKVALLTLMFIKFRDKAIGDPLRSLFDSEE